MNERELFEDAYRKVQLIENDGDTFEQHPNGNYVRFSLNLAWLMWQASVSRQGYKLVPVEASETMVDAACEIIDSDEAWSLYEVYKSMIGAIE